MSEPSRRMSVSTKPSVLDNLGEEMTAILFPVSLCMAFCVFLVRMLTPDGVDSDEQAPSIGTVYYQEQEEDDSGKKFSGALINALIFVAFITVMTFVIFLLFKYRCTNFIWGYMGFAGFSIFAGLGQTVMLQVLQGLEISLDWISYVIIVWNFSVVGTLAVFFWEMPISLKQGYLIFIGAVTAFWFTRIPEWTTWLLLVMMALYDLAAVLTPVGPLRVLVELAQERQEDIPALVYEARPVRRGQPSSALGGAAPGFLMVPVFPQLSMLMAEPAYRSPAADQPLVEEAGTSPDLSGAESRAINPGPILAAAAGPTTPRSEDMEEPLIGATEPVSLEDMAAPTTALQEDRRQQAQQQQQRQQTEEDGDEEGYGLPDAIKLGLGDFIFYSVMVGRAAMYDMMTVFGCYLAIVAGLGATLLLLAVFRKALPALPISIALGVAFYFLVRIVLEPMVVGMSTNLLMF